jgi:hypothetical protein
MPQFITLNLDRVFRQPCGSDAEQDLADQKLKKKKRAEARF